MIDQPLELFVGMLQMHYITRRENMFALIQVKDGVVMA